MKTLEQALQERREQIEQQKRAEYESMQEIQRQQEARELIAVHTFKELLSSKLKFDATPLDVIATEVNGGQFHDYGYDIVIKLEDENYVTCVPIFYNGVIHDEWKANYTFKGQIEQTEKFDSLLSAIIWLECFE